MDRQLDRFADAAEHFHQRINSELRGFFIHTIKISAASACRK
jgi:hypothetical protein